MVVEKIRERGGGRDMQFSSREDIEDLKDNSDTRDALAADGRMPRVRE